MQQRLIAPGQTDHGLIDGGVAVGVELHGLTDNVGGLGAAAGLQTHLVHGVQELPVGGLEAVDLRNGSGDNDRHGVGHVVQLQGLGNGLLRGGADETHHAVGVYFFLLFVFFFSCHSALLIVVS